MLEIKFRGKRKDNNEWLFGDLIQLDDTSVIADYAMFASQIINNHIDIECYEIDKKTICQFIGIKDKLGNDIYTGDIISIDKTASLYKKCPITIISTVIWNCGKYEAITNKVINNNFNNKGTIHFGVSVMDWIHLPEFKDSEIIGNVYDNIELIKFGS